MLFFYSILLILGIILIAIVLIIDKKKSKLVPKDFIRDKLLKFLNIAPLAHKIEILEKELHHNENPSEEKLPTRDENNWKTKYERLETLFQEKSIVIGKIEQALNNEIKNRTEFEDFKYLLEEEIEKGKEKRRQLQMELDSLKIENENLRSKMAELARPDNIEVH